jgi:hypothetical protein
MQQAGRATRKPWFVAALIAWLAVAESFAVAHEYDTAAHSSGQACTVCVGAASLGACDVAALVQIEPNTAASFVAVADAIVFVSVVHVRRYARGPPVLSFVI